MPLIHWYKDRVHSPCTQKTNCFSWLSWLSSSRHRWRRPRKCNLKRTTLPLAEYGTCCCRRYWLLWRRKPTSRVSRQAGVVVLSTPSHIVQVGNFNHSSTGWRVAPTAFLVYGDATGSLPHCFICLAPVSNEVARVRPIDCHPVRFVGAFKNNLIEACWARPLSPNGPDPTCPSLPWICHAPSSRTSPLPRACHQWL